jgi:hypothetical protein
MALTRSLAVDLELASFDTIAADENSRAGAVAVSREHPLYVVGASTAEGAERRLIGRTRPRLWHTRKFPSLAKFAVQLFQILRVLLVHGGYVPSAI